MTVYLVSHFFNRPSFALSFSLLCTSVSLRNTAFNWRSFLHENVFILLFIEGNNDVLHFDITQVKKRFSRDALVTNASLVNRTVACVPVKHRAAFNLRSFLHENVFILPFVEGQCLSPLRHRERERSVRRMCLHKEENIHAQFAQNLRMPTYHTGTGRNSKINKQMLTQNFTNSLKHSVPHGMILTSYRICAKPWCPFQNSGQS